MEPVRPSSIEPSMQAEARLWLTQEVYVGNDANQQVAYIDAKDSLDTCALK
jgi:hypothetical protein